MVLGLRLGSSHSESSKSKFVPLAICIPLAVKMSDKDSVSELSSSGEDLIAEPTLDGLEIAAEEDLPTMHGDNEWLMVMCVPRCFGDKGDVEDITEGSISPRWSS